MATEKRLLGVSPSGDKPNVEDVFSTDLYTGNANAQKITTNVDINEYGGMIWSKSRSSTSWDEHLIMDNVQSPESGSLATLVPSNTFGASYQDGSIGTYVASGWGLNDDGFTLGQTNYMNLNGVDYATWTFRQAPRFFDIVTYIGNGVIGREIAHGLDHQVGFMVVKKTSSNGSNWTCYHRSLGSSAVIEMSGSGAAYTGNSKWNYTHPTTTEFTISADSSLNTAGAEYVAYLFAHDPNGEDDDGMIACGSYTHPNNTSTVSVNLGWEPQWILLKANQSSTDWYIFDTKRGIVTGGLSGDGDAALFSNTSGAENVNTWGIDVTSTGFDATGNNIASGGNQVIYMAIRGPMMKKPESAADVFAIDTGGSSSGGNASFTSGFPVDLAIYTQTTSSNTEIVSRLNSTRLFTNLTNAENSTNKSDQLAFMDGYGDGTYASDYIAWMWKRAKGYFDAVAYNGNGTAGHQIKHNLGVVPEMVWLRSRSLTKDWRVWHKDAGDGDDGLYLNSNTDVLSDSWYNIDVTGNTGYIELNQTGTNFNGSGNTYIAYLFASLAGISKVGSYTGNGSSQTIDCGFSNGARFILIKGATNTENWYVFDSVRGIVAGNDPRLQLDNTSAEFSNVDLVDPHNSGFIINSGNEVNASGIDYIFYAIA